VLITGASGFVGSHFLDALLTDVPDVEVVAVASFTCNGVIDRIVNVVDGHIEPRVTIIKHDLSVPPSQLVLNRIGHVDWILDVASRCSVDESIGDPVCFVANNVAVTLNTLEIARVAKPSIYVHLSTDEVYGPHKPLTPTDHLPSSPYAASKAAQEGICNAYEQTYDVPMMIVNSSNMFGERQSSLAFVPRIVRAALRGEVLSVHVDRLGPGERHYSHARDVANWVISYLLADNDDPFALPPQRLPLTGMHTVDNLTLALRVAAILDRELRYNLISGEGQRRGYDASYAVLEPVDDWLEQFGSPVDRCLTFDRRLIQTVEWFAAHPEWLEL
jgi:dTDP-glucose 4,6-dehydratase